MVQVLVFLTNTLSSRPKPLHFLNLATITSVNLAVSANTLTSKQPAPLPSRLTLTLIFHFLTAKVDRFMY